MKIKKDDCYIVSVLKRYSFITHLLIAISSVGMIAIVPFIDYVPLWVGASITGVLALLGIIGSFVKQEAAEDKQENCRLDDN